MQDKNKLKINSLVGQYMWIVDNFGRPGYVRFVEDKPHSRVQWPLLQARNFHTITREEYLAVPGDLKLWHHFDYLYDVRSGLPEIRVLMALSNERGCMLQRHSQAHEDIPGYEWRTEIILVGANHE